MKLSEFINYLEQSTNKDLIFKVDGLAIPLDYHITEIKDASFKTVDCGGEKDQWRVTVVQLWNTQNPEKEKRSMSAEKALSIISKVNQITPLDQKSTINIEYRKNNSETTAIYAIAKIEAINNKLIAELGNIPTQCKAIKRSQQTCCGSSSSCC